ncbi:uncharacterized protein LOC124405542 isoform X2 [Diprion similis]|uniref:uncharacterized protein LOC124405542 isoform X2 n=1 Tax=Diprion similis TaxID=362088 RepID=UPI001EF8A6B2|nr:uncharacterized protein LOC124405542 isoform X2 [Diprion similis]
MCALTYQNTEHTLTMNTPFHAFQVPERPEVTSYRKHLRLKKSMTLPDDTLEYWGFYLLKGATVALSVCSRFPGGSILVIKGDRSLRTCGIMEHTDQKVLNEENYLLMSKQVHVTVESNAQKMSGQLSMNNKKANQTVSTPHSDSLIDPHNKNQLKFRGKTNMDRSNVRDQMNPTNHPIPKSITGLDLSQVSNNTDLQIALLQEAAISHIQKHSTVHESSTQKGIDKLRHRLKKMHYINNKWDNKNGTKNSTSDDQKRKEKVLQPQDIDRRSLKKRGTHSRNKELFSEREEHIRKLETELNSYSEGINIEDDGIETENNKHHVDKRQPKAIEPSVLLDRGVEHGGNAFNFTSTDEDSSVSSFENGLLTCYNGQILLTQEFDPSELCTNVSFLVNSKRIHTQHDVVESGYYYYIFYSDNDYVSNDMHAIFDIYKPTYQFENVTESCINQTECSFRIALLSGDRVVVEIPTRNGIDREDNNMTLLTSTCYPRMGMYTVFPITVLLLILGCAFL